MARKTSNWAKAAGEFYRKNKGKNGIETFSDVLKSAEFKKEYHAKYGKTKKHGGEHGGEYAGVVPEAAPIAGGKRKTLKRGGAGDNDVDISDVPAVSSVPSKTEGPISGGEPSMDMKPSQDEMVGGKRKNLKRGGATDSVPMKTEGPVSVGNLESSLPDSKMLSGDKLTGGKSAKKRAIKKRKTAKKKSCFKLW